MVCRICPVKRTCFDKGLCDVCDFGKAFDGLVKRIDRLKAKNVSLQEENQSLKDRLETITNPNF